MTPAVNTSAYSLPRTVVREVHTQAGLYRLLVSLPEGKAPAGGFPTLYLMDGDTYFAPATLMVRHSYQADIARAVVGVTYPQGEGRRALDYTPTSSEDGGGGADIFLQTLQHELLPSLEAQFPLSQHRRTLFGHSYGGLFTLYTLLQRPELFWGYGVSSPSLWRSPEAVKEVMVSRRPDQWPLGVWLRHTVGEYEQQMSAPDRRLPPDQRTGRQRHLETRRMVEHSHEVAQALSSTDLRYQFQVYTGQNHNSVPMVALGGAIETMNQALSEAESDRKLNPD